MIRAADLIEKKRDGEEHSAEEIAALIDGYNTGAVPDYQMAAWCMAVFFRGLSGRETYALTAAFIKSGETLDIGSMLGRRVVDKHSTGCVGDKTSIAVGPIIAACGVPFGKMSGRGLGHTGGTLDKLESIPGFRVELSTEELVEQVREIGIAVAGQTADLVPADKKLENGAIQGTTDFGRVGYGGPCPPNGTHRYYFKIYALDTDLKLQPGATKAQLLAAIDGHVLERGQLMGRYARQKD